MAGASSRQASSSSSQARRSTRLSVRNSIVGTPSRARQPSISRVSTRIDPTLGNLDDLDFNWGGFEDLSSEDDAAQNRTYVAHEDFVDLGYGTEQPLNAVPPGYASINYYNNPNVAVPSTPHNVSLPLVNRQMGPPMGYEQEKVPFVINGQTLMLSHEQVDALNAVAGLASQPLLTDGKRTSVPQSPGIRRRNSQFRLQTAYNDPFVGSEHIDAHDLQLLGLNNNNYATYPEPTAYYGGYVDTRQPQQLQQPYYHITQWQGAPSPGGRHIQFPQPEPEYLQPAFPQQTHNNKPASPSRNHSLGQGRRKPPVEPKKNVRHEKAPTSVLDRETSKQYQKPKVATYNPDVRINRTTKGKTTRTAKINEYDPRDYYTYTRHPLGSNKEPWGTPWRAPGSQYVHKYRDSSLKEMDGDEEIAIYELANREMASEEIQDFILNYPHDRNTLTLRIQVAPGDSGRRYKPGAAKCRFKHCPNRVSGLPATILHGWFRVAFDERNDDDYDPFAANCGFAHLYCMERFLDFEYICRKARVVVEFRTHMRNEPKSTFAAAINTRGFGAGQLAEQFISQARNELPNNMPRKRGDNYGVRQMRQFQNYPVNVPYNGQIWDPDYKFEDTLSYHMFLATELERPAAQMSQFAFNGLAPSLLCVHRGDLGMVAEHHLREKQLRKMTTSRNKTKNKGEKAEELPKMVYNGNSSFDVEVRRRIKLAQEVLKRREAEPKVRPPKNTGSKTRAPKGTDRSVEPIDEEEDEEVEEYALTQSGRQPWDVADDASDIEDGRTFRQGTRRSGRNKGKRPVYRDEPDIGQDHEPRSERPLKRTFQEYEKSQQNTDQFAYGQGQQYLQNAYAQNGYAQGYIEEPALKRKRSAATPPGYSRAHSWRPDLSQPLQQWQPNDNDYGLDEDYLFGDINFAPSPKRKRSFTSSRNGGQQQVPQYRTKRLSSLVGSEPSAPSPSGSIMRHPGSRTPSGSKRHASFNNQPVSQQKTFNSDAPPHNVQPRMLKELEIDAISPHGSKPDNSSGRTLRSGRSLSDPSSSGLGSISPD